MKNRSILFGIILMLCVGIVSAETIIQTSPEETNLLIEYPTFETFKLNENITFNFHAINVSSGIRYNNTSIDCFGQIINNYGIWKYPRQQLVWNSEYESWQIQNISFDEVGKYQLIIYCEDTNAGFISKEISITKSGEGEGINPFLPLITLFILSSFFLGVSFPIKNEIGKWASIAFSFALLFVSIQYTLIYIQEYTLIESPAINSFLETLFQVLGWIVGGFVFLSVVYLVLQLRKLAEIRKGWGNE